MTYILLSADLELSELTPMESPFISEAAAANRREITAIFASHGFVTYPYEFWHYNAGDAYEGLLQQQLDTRSESSGGDRAAARYGAVELDLDTGSVTAIAEPTSVLNSAETMRALMDGALEKVQQQQQQQQQSEEEEESRSGQARPAL
jgi:D-alanyl-D-alanine dipeptidase